MNQQPPRHRRIIAAALEDWWITTDPVQPFEPADVADQVDLYLISSGYRIHPDIPRNEMPRLRAIITVAIVTVIVIASTIGAAIRGEWEWAALGAVVTVLLARECIRDLSDRRRGRPAR